MPDDTSDDPRQIIADLQRQVVQYRTERDEALAQQTATAEVLQVINSSPGDLVPVFDAMLAKATTLCEAAFGVLWTYDGEYMHASAITGVPPQFAEFLRRGPHRPAPTMQQALLSGAPFNQIADLTLTEGYRSGETLPRAGADLGGVRTLLGVTLRKDDKVLGVFGIYRQEVRPFTDKQIALLQNFAAQAVVAMENARLLGETHEALEQQTATAEVLQVINSSPGDLAPVFDAMLEKAMRLCDAAFGMMSTYDGEHFHTGAMRGVPEKYAEQHTRNPPHPGPETGLGRIERGEDIVQILDLADSDAYRSGDPRRRDVVDLGGARSYVAVALRKDGGLLGTIAAYRQEVRPFTDKQIALLQNFAAQAVIAMENARLITETREALEQQTATAEVLQVINSSPGDLAPVFEAILEKAHQLCGVTHGGLVLRDGDTFRAVATHSYPDAFVDQLRRGYRGADNPITQSLIAGAPFVHFPDLAQVDHPMVRASVELAGVRTGLYVPLRKDDVLLGMISSARRELQPFSDKEIALLQNFAAQAVIAMENARLISETREALEQQTATAEVLGVINSSPGDLAPVFDAMLEKAISLCEAAFGHLYTYDGELFHFGAAHGDARYVEARRRLGPRRPSSAITWERIVKGETIVQILDCRDTEAYRDDPRTREAIEFSGIRTLLTVALRKDGTLLGVLSIYRQEVRPFSEKQIALLENFAAQAVIAMENARLITETREALEQQTATAEVLRVINSSPGDLAPVFDAMLTKATSLCEASFGILWIFDGEFARAGALHQVPEAYAELCRTPFRPSPESGPARMMQGEASFAIGDLTAHPPYQAGDALTRALVDLGGARSIAIAPLRRDGVTLGAITIYQQDLRPFTDKQIALLENFAAQAVIAMENARLISETREALEQQTATAEVLGVINSSPGDLAPVFDAMLEKATRLCDAVFAALLIYDGENFENVAVRNVPEAFAEFAKRGRVIPFGPGTGPSRLLAGEPFVHILDGQAEEAYRRANPAQRALVELAGARTWVSMALRKDDALLGIITIFRQEVRPFSDKQIALLQNFAAQAVIAMENARLLGELRARTDEVAGWNRELEARVATQLAELERTGRLKRFLAPQLAELIVAQGDESILESHRREIVVVFCDIRGFTAFAERAEPEEVMALLRDYHAALGPIVARFEGTLDHYGGDGIMVFFNDPLPTPDPAKRAIEMAVAMREAAAEVIKAWRGHGHDIGFGVGISQGYATLGQIGFAERMDYTAIGTVTNLAARLCDAAKDGQILIHRRVATAVGNLASLEEVGDLSLKGLSQAVAVYNVAQ